MLTVGHSYFCSKATGTLACAHNVENSQRPVPKEEPSSGCLFHYCIKGMFHFLVDQVAYFLSCLVSTQPAVIGTLFSHFIVENLRFREVKHLGQGHMDSKQQTQISLTLGVFAILLSYTNS